MVVGKAIQQVLSSKIDGFTASKYWEIGDVRVRFNPVDDGVPASSWKQTLEEWLPKFNEVGWVDSLNTIVIEQNAVAGDAVGQYLDNGSISLENDINVVGGDVLVIDDSKEHVLAHEMIHHAHMTINGYESGRGRPIPTFIENQVSPYAGENAYEAVAEIGAGIIHGERFGNDVMDFYEKHDGPKSVHKF